MANSIVTKTGLLAADITGSELYGVLGKASGESAPLGNEVIEQKIRAAEDFYEEDLQTFFNPTKVRSEAQDRGLVLGTDYDVTEPAYDYEPEFFEADNWGYQQVNYRPVRSFDAMFIAFPGFGATGKFNIPMDWLRKDYKFGRIRLLPMRGPTAVMMLGSFTLSVASANRVVPQVVFIDYTAGLCQAELRKNYNHLLEGIRLRTMLLLYGILDNVRRGGATSASLSEDGLSRSQSFPGGKWGAYGPAIELAMQNEKEIRSTWRQQDQGVQCVMV